LSEKVEVEEEEEIIGKKVEVEEEEIIGEKVGVEEEDAKNEKMVTFMQNQKKSMKFERRWTLTEWGMEEYPSEWMRWKGLMQFDLGSKTLEEKTQTGG
jgi:hypothetical protein